MNDVTAAKAARSRKDDWHLARTPDEQMLAAFEFSLERLMHAYYRWKGACLAAVTDGNFSGNDTAILNIIRLKDRPKGLSEICRLLNREDTANIQYTLRKLLKAGLIEKSGTASRKATVYAVTATGAAVTDAYADLRADLLLALTGSLSDRNESFEAAEQFMNLMSGMYDQAATQAAAQRY